MKGWAEYVGELLNEVYVKEANIVAERGDIEVSSFGGNNVAAITEEEVKWLWRW